MAKYLIKHTCDHVAEYNIGGKIDTRAGKRDWLAGQACPGCRKAQQIAAETAQATTARAALPPMPLLNGSVKQVAWADTIRANAIADAYAVVRQMADKATALGQPGVDETVTLYHGYISQLCNEQLSAGWWIDHRTYDAKALLRAGRELAAKI